MTIPLLRDDPFGLTGSERTPRLLAELNAQFRYHYEHCDLFRRLCDHSGWTPAKPAERFEELPYLPAQFFTAAGALLVSVS